MRKYQKFEEVPVWQEAGRLYQRILDLTEEPTPQLSSTFRNQLERAALFVSNSIAEAYDGGDELVSLLGIARSAALEVQSMVAIIAERPKLARSRDALQAIRASADECARQLGAWKFAIENPQKRQPADGTSNSRPASSGDRGSMGSAGGSRLNA